MMDKKIDVIIPTFHCKQMTESFIKSFEKFKGTFDFRYIVVENSDDDSYKQSTQSLANVLWIQNPTDLVGSQANALANEVGLKYVETEYVILCHVDIVACRPGWIEYLFSKIESGCKLVGTRQDTTRVNALHSSFLLVETKIAKSVTMFPVYDTQNNCVADVTDMITVFCNYYKIPYYLCRNTFNDLTLDGKLDRFNGIIMDRAINDDNQVILIHVGRGVAKLMGTSAKPGRLTHEQWIDLCDNIINERI